MKDIDVLKHTSVDHLPLTGGTLTGDLTIKNPSGAVSKLNVHRTLNGQDMQGSFDVYAVSANAGNGACALSTNNKTTGQQEACYVFAKNGLWSPGSTDGTIPSLGLNGGRFTKLWVDDIDAGGNILATRVEATTIVQTSDKKLKENIRYIDSPKKTSKDIKDETITKDEIFNFIKNIKLCEYNYIESDVDKIGIIANDLVGNKVGNKIVTKVIEDITEVNEDMEEVVIGAEEKLVYDVTNMLFAAIGALQEEIRKREELEKENKELKDDIKLIKEKLGI